jgi:hypothetical protein
VDDIVRNLFEGFGEEKAHRKVACDDIGGQAVVHAGGVPEKWLRPVLKWTSGFSGAGWCSRRQRWAGGWKEPGCPCGGAHVAGRTVGKGCSGPVVGAVSARGIARTRRTM